MEYAVVLNDENNDEDSLTSDIYPPPPQTILWKLKEWTEWEMKLKKGRLKEWNLKMKDWNLKLKEWTQTMKAWTTKSYLLIEKVIS